jgi:hypothetical protein
VLGESHRGHFRPCSGGLADAVLRLPEPWLSSLTTDFAGMLSGDIIATQREREREREREGDVGANN